MMTKAFKALWIATLKSGNYAKGRKHLRGKRNDCCCLGVAGDLLVQQGKAKWRLSGNEYTLVHSATGAGNSVLLSSSLCDLVGITDGEQRKLAHTNDRTATFRAVIEQIARLPASD